LPESRAEIEEEAQNIEERARWYLERHGDAGRIDPESQRVRVAAEYRRFRVEAAERRRRPQSVGGTEWVSLGPTNGAGRMTAIAPHPSAAGTAYAGAAGGGVWKTTDGGTTWAPLTEGLHDLSVGALAIAPTNPSIVYLGSGEGGLATAVIPGIGFLKSLDGGVTWILPESVLATGFYRILVHPSNPDELVAGTNAGAFRSTDGGATWTNVIPHDTYGDVPDIVRDASDPRILYATTWCSTVRGCGVLPGRVLRSTDGGATWTDRSNGLPTTGLGGRYERTSLAISASNPSVLYAGRAIQNLRTGAVVSHIFKTTDAGATWTDLPGSTGNQLVSTYLGFQSYYDNALAVSPTNPDVLFAGGTAHIRSSDGGATFGGSAGNLHPDCHDLQYQGSTLWIANDGGIWTSEDDGRTAAEHNTGLVTRQYYALASDRSNRERIVGGSQDNGNVQRLAAGTVWRNLSNAGDGFQAAIHPLSPDLMWSSSQGLLIFRTQEAGSAATPRFKDVSPPIGPEELVPFFTIVRLDPRTRATILTGTYRVWKSLDGGDGWRPLATATTDGSEWDPHTLVTSIAISAASSQSLLIGKARSVYRSDDGGNTWTPGRGLPDAVVTSVELDPRDAFRAWASFATTSGQSVFRSFDGGLSWTPAASGLPPFAAQVVRVDPTDSNDLFCGTDVGVYRSTDAGGTWARFGTGLPAASVHDVEVFEDGSIVRAATYGRGIWELRVPSTGNTPPAAAISAPAGEIAVAAGTTLDFTGSVSDPDPGDRVAGFWFFADDTSAANLVGQTGTVRHVFRRAGLFPVSLSAIDSHGARGTASVIVSVRDAADSCASPRVFPGSGPFPYTIRVDNQSGTNEATDPDLSCFGPGFGRLYTTWFEFTPAAAGTYQFSTCGADVVTVLSLYTGAACGPYTDVPSACKGTGLTDTDCGPFASGMLVSATASAGQTLRVLLSGIPPNPGGSVPVTVTTAGTSPGLRLLRVADSSGPTMGGTTVAVTGSGFVPGSTVTFGGVPAQEVAFEGSTSLTARTPPHAAGPVDVAVTVPGLATAALRDGFGYEDAAPAPCFPSATALCLNGGRFRVESRWRVSAPTDPQTGAGTAVPLTSDTGYFWFFSPNNVELVVKVVDGRPVNGKFWVFYGALSDVEYQIAVTDIVTGAVKVYSNPSGTLASVADTNAF
jgi:photosystem II stability/assembly factor-like uncharacterized protein